MRYPLLLVIVSSMFLAYKFKVTTCTEFCVKNSQSQESSKCQTLQYYAEDSENISKNENVTMIFLPGNHLLEAATTLHLQNMKNLVFTTWTKKKDVTISVGSKSGLALEKIVNVTIQFVTIIFVPIDDAAIFSEINLLKFIATNITYLQGQISSQSVSPSISNIRYTEILESTFWHCILTFGTRYSSSFEAVSVNLQSGVISEIRFQSLNLTVNVTVDHAESILSFKKLHICNRNSGINIKLQNSKVTLQMEYMKIQHINEIGVLVEDLSKDQFSDMTLNFTNCLFENNTNGITVHTLTESGSTLRATMENIHFKSNRHGITINSNAKTYLILNVTASNFTENKNAITLYNQESKNETVINMVLSMVLNMGYCKFTHNVNNIIIHKSQSMKMQMTIEFCNFIDNTGVSMLVDATSKKESEDGSMLMMHNCTFMRNTELLQGISTAVIQLHGYIEATLSDCLFTGNQNTPIEIDFGNLVFAKNNTFLSNRGNFGGAIHLIYSQIIFLANAKVHFVKNYATNVGGAIYLEKKPSPSNDPPCFYSVQNDSQVCLIDNEAKNGGDAIYGAGLNDTCIANEESESTSVSIYRDHFKFSNYSTLSQSLITSDPKRVCLCLNNTPICANLDYIFHTATVDAYPGENFVFYIALVGCEFGTVVGTAYIKAVERNYIQTETIYGKTCTALNFTINSNENTAIKLVLTTEALSLREYGDQDDIAAAIESYNHTGVIPKTLLTTPVYIDIRVGTCPIGFTFKNDTQKPRCACDYENEVTCIICNSQRLFKVSETQWVGKGTNSEVLYTEHAPHGHVNTIIKWVSLDGVGNECPAINSEPIDIDEQCANNHTGRLCGKCQHNFSLTLGRPECKTCSNKNGILLIFFILAGPLLVALIKILNLTVTSGSINGLIIYANLVWANERIIFNSTESDFNEYFLKTFIAWLNLDFGITVCFFNGFNSVWKAYLQFLFPIYMWILVLAIKFASDYSAKVARVFGSNSVCILATLFLLSYSKLLAAVTSVFDGTNLGSVIVWTKDGTIDYLSNGHIGLFIISLPFSLFFLLPFTISLLFIQYLRAASHLRPFSWVNKQKPYFDAYTGILEDKHQYWVGLLLLARCAMLITTAITQDKRYDLIALGIISAMLSIHTGVYKKTYLNLIEKSFLLNLNLFAAALIGIYAQTGFDKMTTDYGNIVTSVFVGICFIQFIGIIILQMIIQLYNTKDWKQPRCAEENEYPPLRMDT